MMKLLPLLALIAYGMLAWQFSAWSLKRQLDARSKELREPALSGILARLARGLEIDRVRVHLYDVPQVNGLAAPDGRIFITRGFVEAFKAGKVSAEEMASVIAHEMGHVVLGHARKRQIAFVLQNAVRAGLAATLLRFIPGVGGWVAAGITSLVASKLSRSDEFAADAYATALLIRAGIGATPQKTLFGKLGHLTGSGGGGAPAWMMSHPPAAERIRAIETNEAKWAAPGRGRR